MPSSPGGMRTFGASSLPHRRRAPYPVSPTIGPEGVRACQEIVEAARRLFVERGYHGTSILAIAEATGRSDAAFYQYFHGKQELFRIFFEDLGRDLVEHFRGLPDLSGDPVGFAALRHWLDGLGAVLRDHSPVFVDWPTPAVGEPAVENPYKGYLDQLAAELGRRLGSADPGGLDVALLSITMISLVEWSHLALQALAAETSDGAKLDETLAGVIHRSLFPEPGPPVAGHFATGYSETGYSETSRPVAWPAVLSTGTSAIPGLRKAVTRRAFPTIDKITAAASLAFERRGLSGTSVNDVIAEAGVAHGTLYQYWTDLHSLFTTLAHACASATCEHLDTLPAVETEQDVRRWLETWLDVVDRHGSTFHVWTTEALQIPSMHPLVSQMQAYVEDIAVDLLRRHSPTAPLDGHRRRSTAVALWTLLAEFPYNAWRRHPILTREEVLRAQTLFLTRGFLAL